MDKNFLDNLSDDQEYLNMRVFNLIIGRVLKIVYLGLSENDKENMEKVFLSGNDKEKEDFIKKYIPNFEEISGKEAQKVEEEIKLEIEKIISSKP